MKNKIAIMLTVMFCLILLSGCGEKKTSNSATDDKYVYDKYGYTKPNEGESFSDYVKRQDPDLYNNMEKRYYGLK